MIFEGKRHCEKYIFDISGLFIQGRKDSCCEHIASDVNVYLYVCHSTAPLTVFCVFVVYDIKSEYQQKTSLCVRPQ